MARILAFAGSARKESINKKLVAFGADKARALGAEVTFVDLNDYPMPLYHGDLEAAEGVPENVRRLRTMMIEHDGMLIACPEYNSSITPLLKNTIDWCTRPDGDLPGGIAFRHKVAALIATSEGALGGLRGLDHVREILANIGVHVVPMQAAVGHFGKAFDAKGGFTDERTGQFFESVIGLLVKTCDNLRT